MPIPRYERRVDATGIQTPANRAEMPGASNAAQAGAPLLKQAYDLAEAEKKKADEAEVMSAWTKAVRRRNELVHNDLANMQGEGAKNAPSVLAVYDTDLDGLSSELGNESQRQMFGALREKERNELDGIVTNHIADEGRKLEAERFAAGMDTLVSDGVLNYRRPNKVANVKAALGALIDHRADTLGWSPEKRAEAKFSTASGLNKGIVYRELANENVPAAEAWYLQSKKELTGQDITDIEARLHPAKERYGEKQSILMSQELADKYLMNYSDETAAMADLEEEHKGKPYLDGTKQLVKAGFARRRDVEQFDYNDIASRQLENSINGKPIDRDEFTKLRRVDREKIVQYSVATKAWGANAVSASGDAFIALRRMAANSPGDFMRENLVPYGLEPDLYRHMRDMQLGMIKRNEKVMDEVRTIRSDSEKVNDFVRALDIDDDAKRAEVEAQIDKAFVDFQRNNKRRPTDLEFQQVLDTYAVKVKNGKRLWFDKKERIADVTVDEVPGDFRDAADKWAGRKMSDQEVLSLWHKQLRKENANAR